MRAGGSCEAEHVALKRALSAVLCVALGTLSGSCAGGPTSDWPPAAGGDDDSESPVPDKEEPPRGHLDAGTGAAFQDAGRPPVTDVGGDGGDAGDAEADASSTLPNVDAGTSTDASTADDAAPSDAQSSP